VLSNGQTAPTPSDEATHDPNCAGLLARAIQQLETCANKQTSGVRAGASPLKSILVGSTLVDRPAAVPAFIRLVRFHHANYRARGRGLGHIDYSISMSDEKIFN
jgi:hypothetical protein